MWPYFSRWLERPSSKYFDVSESDPKFWRSYIFDTHQLWSSCVLPWSESLQHSLYQSSIYVRRSKQSMLPLTKGLGTFESNPQFFLFFYIYKEIFLRPSGSGGELWPNVFGPIAPGICDVFCQVLDIDPLTPIFCQQIVSWAWHLFLGCLRDLIPSCWLLRRASYTFLCRYFGGCSFLRLL